MSMKNTDHKYIFYLHPYSLVMCSNTHIYTPQQLSLTSSTTSSSLQEGGGGARDESLRRARRLGKALYYRVLQVGVVCVCGLSIWIEGEGVVVCGSTMTSNRSIPPPTPLLLNPPPFHTHTTTLTHRRCWTGSQSGCAAATTGGSSSTTLSTGPCSPAASR